MILFTFGPYFAMGAALEKLPFCRAGLVTMAHYENGELHASTLTPVSGEHCLVLGSVAPLGEQLLSVLLLAHTLKKEGARKVTALLPYLAYRRQDKDKPGQSLATAWAGSLLQASGFDQVITIDSHSERDRQLFPIPLISFSTAGIFADAIRKYQLTDATIVAPDNGAIGRCDAVKRAAGMARTETPYFEKQRTETGITHVGPIGSVGTRVVIIDDMIDTGTTLVSACEKLHRSGVQEIYIMVTHGLFTGANWKKLWTLGVRRIFCTDTLPLAADLDERNIVSLSVIPLLQQELLSLQTGGESAEHPALPPASMMCSIS